MLNKKNYCSLRKEFYKEELKHEESTFYRTLSRPGYLHDAGNGIRRQQTMRLYSDIAGEKCEGAVSVLSALGVVDGYEDGTYKPEQDSYESGDGEVSRNSSGRGRTMRRLRSPAIPTWQTLSGRFL